MNTVIIFFFNDTATTEIYTLSLHDALPISTTAVFGQTTYTWTNCAAIDIGLAADWNPNGLPSGAPQDTAQWDGVCPGDRKSTRLNSSHVRISYAVFCLEKKTNPRPARFNPC